MDDHTRSSAACCAAFAVLPVRACIHAPATSEAPPPELPNATVCAPNVCMIVTQVKTSLRCATKPHHHNRHTCRRLQPWCQTRLTGTEHGGRHKHSLPVTAHLPCRVLHTDNINQAAYSYSASKHPKLCSPTATQAGSGWCRRYKTNIGCW